MRRNSEMSAPDAVAASQRAADEPMPAYRRIEAVLRDQIASGEYAQGERLPTEARFCEMFGASRPTVRQALSLLEADRLVSRQHGRGTFVAERKARPVEPRFDLSIVDLIETPAALTISLQRSGGIRGHGRAHEMLGAPEGAELGYVVRVFSLNARPLGGEKVYLRRALFDALSEDDLRARDIRERIRRRAGAVGARSTFEMEATLADPRFAEMLRTRTGAPLVALRRTTRDAARRGLEHGHLLFRPDRVRLLTGGV